MAAPRKKKVTKKIETVTEIQSYINGAIEFNEDSWHPNKKQWDNIVELIMNIVPEVAAPAPVAAAVVPVARPGVMGQSDVTYGAEQPESNQEFSMAPKTDMRAVPSQQSSMMGDKDAQGVISSGMTVRTPSLDTSDGPYQSQF